MTVFLVIEENHKYGKNDVTIFRRKEDAKRHMDHRVEKMLNEPYDLKVGYISDTQIHVVWKNEEYEDDYDIFCNVYIEKKAVR